MTRPPGFWTLLKTALGAADRDGIPRLGAALSFYILFSLAPLLLVGVTIAGAVFEPATARAEIVGTISKVAGEGAAQVVERVLEDASISRSGLPATIVGIVTFFLGATAAFSSLQSALNIMWNVKPPPRRVIWDFLRKRLLSFVVVVGSGVLAVAALLVSTALAAAGTRLSGILPGFPLVWHGVDFVVSLAISTVFFAMIYKVLPDVHLAWGDVWWGATVTAVLFVVGKTLIGLYRAHPGLGLLLGPARALGCRIHANPR